jgi:rod shape-determining protein MreD
MNTKGISLFIFLIILSVVAHFPNIASIFYAKPNLTMIIIFFFALLPAFKISHILLICLGLFEDSLSGSHLGLTSLTYCLLYSLAANNLNALSNQKFLIVWSYFSIVLVSLVVLKALLSLVIFQESSGIQPIALTCLLTILFYPFLHLTLSKIANRSLESI